MYAVSYTNHVMTIVGVPAGEPAYIAIGRIVTDDYRKEKVGRATKQNAGYFLGYPTEKGDYFSTWNVGLQNLGQIAVAPKNSPRINCSTALFEFDTPDGDEYRESLLVLFAKRDLKATTHLIIEEAEGRKANLSGNTESELTHQSSPTAERRQMVS